MLQRMLVVLALGLSVLVPPLTAQDPEKPKKKEAKEPALREREKEKSAPKKDKAKGKSNQPATPRTAEALKSGPQPGEFIPGTFAALNINGRYKDRHHCLVCEYGSEPVVLVFAREPAEGMDNTLTDLMKKLDEVVDRHQREGLHSFVVFLSPDAPGSAAGSTAEDADRLVKEAGAREALTARLRSRAEKLKNVVVTYYAPEGPKAYKINEKAEVTVLFYAGLKVLANYAFPPGEMNDAAVTNIIRAVDTKLSPSKSGRGKTAAR